MLPSNRRALSIVILLLLVSVAVTGLFGATVKQDIASAQSNSTTSCPSNQIFHFVTEPIPNTFNLLVGAGGDSTFIIGGGIEQMSMTPFPLGHNETPWLQDSLTDVIISNSNYTQWTFHVRDGLKWSNGQNITAQDILNWLSPGYALNPTYDFVGLHSEISSEHAINSSTLVLNLNVSDAHLPEKLSTYYYAPVEPPSDVSLGPTNNLFGTDVVSGPFYVSNYTSGATVMTMLRNQYYTPTPGPCEIQVNFVESSSSEIPFLVSGTADFAGHITFGDIPAIQNIPFIHIVHSNGTLGTELLYNVTSYPYNMTAFRQALAYAINFSAIVQNAYDGYGVSGANAQGEVPSSFTWWNPKQVTYNDSIATSLNLLHSLGFTGGGSAGALKFPNGTAMTTTIWTDNAKSWDLDVASAVQSDLAALGIQANIQSTTIGNLIGDYNSNSFNIRNNLFVYSTPGPQFEDPWLDAQPQCTVFGVPGCFGWQTNNHWEWPPSADAQYQSNLTAIDSTANVAQERTYLNNIQLLNANYLPMIVLGYPDEVDAYSSQHFTNWPLVGDYYWFGAYPNKTMFAAVQPVGTASSTNSLSSSSSSSTSALQSSSTSSVTATTSTLATGSTSATTATSSATQSNSNTNTYLLIAAVVIVIIIIAGAATYMMRRRPARAT